MPESLSPTDIEFFINNHPGADLRKMWQAVGIKDNDGPHSPARCASCEAETFFYDLDDEPAAEALLKVFDRMGEAARFVIFKKTSRDRWKVIGHTDVWGKYIEPYHIMLLSDGKPWLVIRGQAASGSGVAFYLEYIFQVIEGRWRPVAVYPAEGYQSGVPDGPTREFTARPIACQVRNGRSIVELDLYVGYSFYDPSADETDAFRELFSRRQRATLVNKLGSDSDAIDLSRSDLSQKEFNAVYNIDSLYDDDFVKYNFAELSRIAAGHDRRLKEWLRDFLTKHESTIEVRQLQGVLASSGLK